MYDTNICERMACSQADKKEALVILDKILELSRKTQHSGLLSLEPEIDIVQPELFKKSIQLLIEGIEPETLREILMNYALCEGYKGKELLKRILIIEGILAIQQGIHTYILQEKLSSFFGEDFIPEIQKHFGLDCESHLEELEAYIARNHDKSIFSKETSLLEDPLNRMDNRSLQRLLREIDSVTLATAISGSSGKTQARVLKNVSKKLAAILIDELNNTGSPSILEIADSQKQILETMHSLWNQGDIII